MIGHKLLRIAFWVVFGGVPIVGLLLGALWTVVDGIKGRDDEFPGSWVYRRIFLEHRSFVFTVSVDLSVDGERLRLDRAIKCQYYVHSHEFGLPWLPNYAVAATVRSFGQELASGAAVIVVTPDTCNGQYWDSGRDLFRKPSTTGSAANFVPLVAWTPRAHDLDTLELYVARSYYENPASRVKIHHIDVRRSPPGTRPDTKDKFAWLGVPIPPLTDPVPYTVFAAWHATPITEDLWKRFPELARLVGNAQDELLDRETTLAVGRRFVVDELLMSIRGGVSVPPGKTPELLRRSVGEQYERLRFATYDQVRPIRALPQSLAIAEEQAGLVVFLRRDVFERGVEPGPPNMYAPLRSVLTFKGKTIDLPVGPVHALYDRQNQTIYFLRQRLMKLRP